MDQHIERILNQIPGWNVADAIVTPLVGGITNQNHRIDIGEETFVLRKWLICLNANSAYYLVPSTD